LKNIFLNILILLALSLFLMGNLPTAQALAMDAGMVGVKIMKKELVGKFLTDGNSMTLYNYTKDKKNKSNCIEGCAVNWPPFYGDLSTVHEDLETGDFATMERTDGRKQTTYKGMPLYYFKNDRLPGDTYGHGIGGVWHIIIQ
jgi:predicted lipoprotein with Yx(FWY)xxD motif